MPKVDLIHLGNIYAIPAALTAVQTQEMLALAVLAAVSGMLLIEESLLAALYTAVASLIGIRNRPQPSRTRA